LFTQVPLRDVPGLLGDPADREMLTVTARTNLVANVLILAIGTPMAYLLATRRFLGRGALMTLVELPLVLPPAVAGIGLLVAVGAGGRFDRTLAGARIEVPRRAWRRGVRPRLVASRFYRRAAVAALGAGAEMLPAASRTPGAAALRAFRRVPLPLPVRGLLA